MSVEVAEQFECFGSVCGVLVSGDGAARSAHAACRLVRRELLGYHVRFSRFLASSELSRLNGDTREEVPVSRVMALFAQAVSLAGSMTGGLVDATMIEEIELSGYAQELSDPLPLAEALRLAPERRPAAPGSPGGWSQIEVDLAAGVVRRPPGLQLDSGGLAKGLFADLLGEELATHPSFAIDCAGDLAIGGSAAPLRAILVESPFDGSTLHTFELPRTGVATSGIGRRSWLDRAGRPAHHLLDPSTGRPAFTGIVQVTALAPSALLAEIHAKAALLSGPQRAISRLPYGGVVVLEDGSHVAADPPRQVTLSDLSGFRQRTRSGAGEDQGHAPGLPAAPISAPHEPS